MPAFWFLPENFFFDVRLENLVCPQLLWENSHHMVWHDDNSFAGKSFLYFK